MKKIGVGIIGLGVIGERLIHVFNQHERTNLIGGFDVDSKRTDYFKKEYGLDIVCRYEELIDNDAVDMIYIAVPPKYHHEIALKVMAAGKHVFCEKPLASTIEEAKEMSEKAEATSVVNGMNFPLYYGYAYNKIKEFLKDNKLGEIRRIELTAIFPVWPRTWQQNNWIDSKEEGGFVREVFTHFIQLVQASFGEITNIQSIVEYPADPSKCEKSILAVGDVQNINILFNGMSGINQKEDLKLTIYGENGSLELLNWRDLFFTNDEGRQLIEPEAVNPTYDLIDALYNAIDGKDTHLVSFRDGYLATKVVETLL